MNMTSSSGLVLHFNNGPLLARQLTDHHLDRLIGDCHIDFDKLSTRLGSHLLHQDHARIQHLSLLHGGQHTNISTFLNGLENFIPLVWQTLLVFGVGLLHVVDASLRSCKETSQIVFVAFLVGFAENFDECREKCLSSCFILLFSIE